MDQHTTIFRSCVAFADAEDKVRGSPRKVTSTPPITLPSSIQKSSLALSLPQHPQFLTQAVEELSFV